MVVQQTTTMPSAPSATSALALRRRIGLLDRELAAQSGRRGDHPLRFVDPAHGNTPYPSIVDVTPGTQLACASRWASSTTGDHRTSPRGHRVERRHPSIPSTACSTARAGRVAPFDFTPSPPGNGLPAADPFVSLTDIDASMLFQSVPCSPSIRRRSESKRETPSCEDRDHVLGGRPRTAYRGYVLDSR